MKFEIFTHEKCDLRFDLVLGISQGCQVSNNEQGGLGNPFRKKYEILNFYQWGM